MVKFSRILNLVFIGVNASGVAVAKIDGMLLIAYVFYLCIPKQLFFFFSLGVGGYDCDLRIVAYDYSKMGMTTKI